MVRALRRAILSSVGGWVVKRLAMPEGEEMSMMRWVVGLGRRSIPRGVKPREGRERTRADPRWPEEPVTRTMGAILGVRKWRCWRRGR